MTTEENKNPSEEKAATETKKAPAKSRAPRAPRRNDQSTTAPDLDERVVAVNRVAKVVKGGRRFSFSALVIVGDQKGKVGYGLGKAKEVPDAIRKASQVAAKSMIYVPVEKGTLPHEVLGEFDAGKILFKPASEGTGIKAAGACRTILELAGVKNVLTKSMRGNNPHNVVKATFAALKNIRSVEQVAKARGVDAKTLRISNHK
jgi:small subunit ribosomal protein S5